MIRQTWIGCGLMKPKISFWIFLLGLLLAGCATLPLYPDNPSPPETENKQIEPKDFSNYYELFKYIAKNEGFEPGHADNEDFLLKLAADSKIETYQVDGIKLPVIIVTPHYYTYLVGPLARIDELRGAQGNGDFYLLLPLKNLTNEDGSPDPGFRIVGIAEGNSYWWSSTSFNTGWHISAYESPKSVYEWDGKLFKLMTK